MFHFLPGCCHTVDVIDDDIIVPSNTPAEHRRIENTVIANIDSNFSLELKEDVPLWIQELKLLTTDGRVYSNHGESNKHSCSIKITRDNKVSYMNLSLQDKSTIKISPTIELPKITEIVTKSNSILDFDDASLSKLKPYTISGGPFACRVHHAKDVYDGDTINVCIDFHQVVERFIKLSVRLDGIDTAELKPNLGIIPKNKKASETDSNEIKRARKAREQEIAYAEKTRDALRAHLKDKKLEIMFTSNNDKYGRGLGTIYIINGDKRENINKWMLEQGYACVYEGGPKNPWIFNKSGDPILEEEYVCVSDSESR